GGKQGRKALVLHVATEQCADAGAGDTKGIARFAGEHEDVAEQFAHRIGIDVAAVRRTAIAASAVPIGEEFPAGRMFHTNSPRCPPCGTVLSRFRAHLSLRTLCRRDRAASMPPALRAAALRR